MPARVISPFKNPEGHLVDESKVKGVSGQETYLLAVMDEEGTILTAADNNTRLIKTTFPTTLSLITFRLYYYISRQLAERANQADTIWQFQKFIVTIYASFLYPFQTSEY